MNRAENPGNPQDKPGRTLLLAPHPNCLIQAARIMEPGDEVQLAMPGQKAPAGDLVELSPGDVSPKEMRTGAKKLDLGHPQLWPYLWHQIDLALLLWPDSSPINKAIKALARRPFRLSRRMIRSLEAGRGLSAPFLVAHSPRAAEFKTRIIKLAKTGVHATVLGQEGAGQEATAHLIHKLSGRANKPLGIVDCAGSAEQFLRSEIFGHVSGVFTWAAQDHPGLLDNCREGGVLLLNSQHLPPRLRADVARFMKSGQYQRAGETGRQRRSSARILTTATPHGEARSGRRLSGPGHVELTLPRLTDLRNDLPPIVRYQVWRLADGEPGREDIQDTLDYFDHHASRIKSYGWTGGMVEINSLITRRLFLGEDVCAGLGKEPASDPVPAPMLPQEPAESGGLSLRPLDEIVREYVRSMDAARKSMSRKELARRLGISPGTLYKYLRSE